MSFFFFRSIDIIWGILLVFLLGYIHPYLGLLSLVIFSAVLFCLRKKRFYQFFSSQKKDDEIFISPVSGKITKISSEDKYQEIIFKVGLFSGWGVYLPVRSRILNFGSQLQGKKQLPFWASSSKVSFSNYDYDFIDCEAKKFYYHIHYHKKYAINSMFLEVDSGDIGQASSCVGLILFGGVIRLLVPNELNLKLKLGQKVKARKTLIGSVE